MPASLSPLSLSNSSGLTLSTLPYGLTFHALTLDLKGHPTRDLLVGPADPAKHHALQGRRFMNQTVGRYANRLPAGPHETASGAKLDLPGDDGVCLHGGVQGLDTVPWDTLAPGTSKLFPASEGWPTSALVHRIVSPAGTDGFPLELEIEGLVNVEAPKTGEADVKGRVQVVLRAKIVDDGSEAVQHGTPVNLTVHWGFNTSEWSSEDVLGHRLYINADKTTALDDKMLATGKLDSIPVGDALDFYSAGVGGRVIGDNFPDGGVDHNFVLRGASASEPQVTVTSPDDLVSLEFRTNQRAVQCYTASGFNGTGYARKALHDPRKEGGYGRFGAVFLEFHAPLASYLHKELAEAGGSDTVLHAGELYENSVEVTVVAKA